MRTRGDILRAHYLGLLKRAGTWSGIAAVIAALIVPASASATGQLTVRSATLGSSTPGASTNISFSFKPATTATIKAITFQLCSSPLDQGLGTCSAVGSSTMASAAFSTAGQSAPFNANWALGTGSDCGADTSTRACIFWTTGTSLTSGTAYTVNITGITIPNTANTEFYTRIATWTGAAAGTPSGETDFGGEALSTGTTMSETAVVQESLVMAIGTSGSSCSGISGSPSITLSNSPMSTTTTSSGTALICVNTNAQSGYRLAYTGTAFSGGGTTFPTVAAPTAGFTSTTGTQQFGFNLVDTAESGGVGKCDSSAGGTTPDSGSYCVSSQYNYDTSAGLHNIASSEGGPSGDTIYTATFKANIDTAVKPGTYTATQTYVATGTF